MSTVGSLADIKKHEDSLKEGMKVIFYRTDEFEVSRVLAYEQIWLGIPDFSTIHYYNSEGKP